mgnify:CR=1 FL=1
MSDTPNENPLASIMNELSANVMRSKPKDRYLFHHPEGYYRIITSVIRSGIAKTENHFRELLEAERISLIPFDKIPKHGSDKQGFGILIDPYDLMVADNRVYWVHVPLDAIRSTINLYLEWRWNSSDLKGIQNLVIDWKSTDGSILDRIKAQEFRMGVES